MTHGIDLFGDRPGMVANADTLIFQGHDLTDVLQRAASWYARNSTDTDGRRVAAGSLWENGDIVSLVITTEPAVTDDDNGSDAKQPRP